MQEEEHGDIDTILVDLRDELALRKMRGEKLTQPEQELLEFVNKHLKMGDVNKAGWPSSRL